MYCRNFAIAAFGIAASAMVMLAGSSPSDAASVRYCQAVCADSSSAACFERCRGNDPQKYKKKIEIRIPPTDEPPVVKSVKQPEWMATVFEPKGGGGGGGGGGNGR